MQGAAPRVLVCVEVPNGQPASLKRRPAPAPALRRYGANLAQAFQAGLVSH